MPSLQRSTAPVGLRRGVPVTQGNEEVTALCKKALSCMQRVLWRDDMHMYSMLKALGISQVLPYLTVELLEDDPFLDWALLGPSGPIAKTYTSRQDAALVFGQSTVRLYLKGSSQRSSGSIFNVGSAARELSRLFSAEAIGQLAEGAALRRYPKDTIELQRQLAKLLKEPDMEKLMQEEGIPQLPADEPSWLDNVAGTGPFANPPPVSEAAASPEDPPANCNKNGGNGNGAVDQNAPGAGSANTTTTSTAASRSIGPTTQATAVVPCSSTAAGELVGVPTATLAPRDVNKVVNDKYKQAAAYAQVCARAKEKQEKRDREERLRQQQEGQQQEVQRPQGFSQAGMASTQLHHYSADEVRRTMSAASVKSRQTGKQGEVMAVQELIKGLSREFKVKWLDADGSTMKPYDIEVEPAMDRGARAAGAKRSLVEVKSTAKVLGGCVEFYLSPNQFKAALEHGAAYEVFLVRGTEEESPDMIQLPNPAALWRQGRIRMEQAVHFSLDPKLAEEMRL
ncbi:hypothetical protein DUNSADRAFT_9863 [Dunaliella salina]|uniref:Protein NO VEIN C-terminal domain-containing protein n=1 Tax=Dunaliella salina TaxID=3046 RepID=A0ABQ7H553_DUNSA|nr:hypothetical protein DUNSADRAFT_9863 [Dunaliella salina]|eukprot:KAF5841982.1 hypothetical protein DUNSADRAFT_9863 [Dunaliella salina]